MSENIQKSSAHGVDDKNSHGRAVGAEPKKWTFDVAHISGPSEGVAGTEASAPALCEPVAQVGEGVPIWSVWEIRDEHRSLMEGAVIVARRCDDGAIEVVSEAGRVGRYTSEEALRDWRRRIETDGEKAARDGWREGCEIAREERDEARAEAEVLRRNNEELAASLRQAIYVGGEVGEALAKAKAEASALRNVLDEEGHISTAVRACLVGGGFSAHWRMGTALTVGPRRETEAEALWDCSIAAGEMARGKSPTPSEVEALVVGLNEMASGWEDEVCPRAMRVARGHVSSESGKTDDGPTVGDRGGEVYFAEPIAVQGALSDARELHAADCWAELAGDVPGLTMVLPLAAWFAVALEGEASSRALDTEAERVAVGLVLARAWLLRQDACEVREVIGKAAAAAGLTMGDVAIVVARARGLSGYGCES